MVRKRLFWVSLPSAPDKHSDSALYTSLIAACAEAGADAIMADPLHVRALCSLPVIGYEGDLVPDRDLFFVTVQSRDDEQSVLECAAKGIVIIRTPDWKIIPLENCIAQKQASLDSGTEVGALLAAVSTVLDAKTALSVLEYGVDGIFLETDDVQVISEVGALLYQEQQIKPLETLFIDTIRPVGMGMRACVDTCALLSPDQGMLISSDSSHFVLIASEAEDSLYAASRPFRVNAGGIFSYIMMADNKTAYLSELRAGDQVLVVDSAGKGSLAIVGRVKIENRPMLLIEIQSKAGKRSSVMVQNAETIRMIRSDGSITSIVDLRPGDQILGRMYGPGRHFGMPVSETIVER